MEEPLFKTQKTGMLTAVEIYPDRLSYSSKLAPLAQAQDIPLEQILQTAFVPKPPGANPNLIDLAVKVRGKPTIVLKDLDIGEAKEIKDLVKQTQIQKPQEVREEHPFTIGGRVLKALKDKKEGGKTAIRPPTSSRPTAKSIPRISDFLPFRH